MKTELNYTDAIYTASHLLVAFQRMVISKLPNTAVIFDQSLSYETGIETLLGNFHFNTTDSTNKPDNILIYNRSVMETSQEGAGSRLRQQRGTYVTEDGEVFAYKPALGEFDINFIFAAHNIEDMLKFETFYKTNGGIGDKEVTINLADLGSFTYYLKYLDLNDIQHASGSADTSYKMIGGVIRARGVFFTFLGSKESVAKLNLRLFDKATPLENSILLQQWSK